MMKVLAEGAKFLPVYVAPQVLYNFFIIRLHMNRSTKNLNPTQSEPHTSEIIQCRQSHRWTDGGTM